MPTTSSQRKIKKSFSISAESDLFIRKMQKQKKTRSESETLDTLLGELMAYQEKHSLETAYAAYYDSLTDTEQEEQRSWGALAEDHLLNEEI